MTKYRVDITGRQFGHLIAIRFVGKIDGNRNKWECRCVCGKLTNVRTSHLSSGAVKSCGCQAPNTNFTKLPPGAYAFNQIIKDYRISARRRGHEWSMSKEAAIKLFTSNCHYCDSPPSNKSNFGGNGEVVYNGIDRIDNTKGYTPNNCVACCKQCNYFKGNMPLSEFLDQIRAIYTTLHRKGVL